VRGICEVWVLLFARLICGYTYVSREVALTIVAVALGVSVVVAVDLAEQLRRQVAFIRRSSR